MNSPTWVAAADSANELLLITPQKNGFSQRDPAAYSDDADASIGFLHMVGTYPGLQRTVHQYTREAAMDEPTVVLVVDDDTAIQQIVAETLSEGGFASKAASSGEEAIGLLSANRYRVLIIDVAFGKDGVKGWAVARRARASNSTLPVIYITGGSADEWSIQGVPNSILLRKPFAPAQLLAAVSQLLNTGPSSVPRFA